MSVESISERIVLPSGLDTVEEPPPIDLASTAVVNMDALIGSSDEPQPEGSSSGEHGPPALPPDPFDDARTDLVVVGSDPLDVEPTGLRVVEFVEVLFDPAQRYGLRSNVSPSPVVSVGARTALSVRRLRTSVVVLALLLLAASSVGIGFWWSSAASREALLDAVAAARHDGRPDTYRLALERARDASSAEGAALELELLATGALEHGVPGLHELEEVLSGLSEAEASRPEARLARAYHLLGVGEPEAARQALRAVEPDNAEHLRAGALIVDRLGNESGAALMAKAAFALHPRSPRHAALLAVLMAKSRQYVEALAVLDAIPEGEGAPAVRVARARLLDAGGGDPARARAEADAVLRALADEATTSEIAWAHLIKARHAVRLADTGEARRQALAAAEAIVAADDPLKLAVAATLVDVGELVEASELLEAVVGSSEPRALLLTEVRLAEGDIEGAEEALRGAGHDAHAALLRGLLAESRGSVDEALALHARAAEDPRYTVRATARLGEIAVEAGRPERAIALLSPLRARATADPRIVIPLVQAWLAIGAVEEARAAVDATISVRGTTPLLLLARADVEMAEGHQRRALATLEDVLPMLPDDPELHVRAGMARWHVGERAGARESFERALDLEAAHPRALEGLMGVALDEADLNTAADALAIAEEAGIESPGIDLQKSRLSVARGRGAAVVPRLRRFVRQDARAPALRTLLGRAYAQAERLREAERSFVRAISLDRNQAEAHLGLARIRVLAGVMGRAAMHLRAARRAAVHGGLGRPFEARVLAVEGRVHYELGRFAEAEQQARESIELHPGGSAGHLLLAQIAIEQSRDSVPHLRAALAGVAPAPEAMGLLLARVDGVERCEIARRYLESAPQGHDASRAAEAIAHCP